MNETLDNLDLSIQRQKQTIFEEVHKTTSVMTIKKIITGILKVPPIDQQLHYKGQIMDDTKTLLHYGIVPFTTDYVGEKIIPIGLTLRKEGSEDFEELEITPYSVPAEL